MKNRIHPIATVTTATGIKGEVRLRPLSRYFDDYLKENNVLFLGFSPEATENIHLEVIKGMGKKRRFKFEGVDSVNDAERIIGQTVFIKASEDDEINLISKDLLGFDVITDTGEFVGILKDVIWLPSNDAYLIHDGKSEKLIPVIPEVVMGMDLDEGLIVIMPMDGLLD